MTVLRALLVCLVTLLASYSTIPAAMADDLKDAINALAEGSLKDREAKVDALLETGDDTVVPVLTYLAEGDLYFRKSDKQVFLADKTGRTFSLTDPISGDVIPDISKRDIKKVRVNNNLRRQIRDGLSLFALNSRDPAKRLAAAETIYKAQDASALPAIEARLAKEQDAQVIAFLQEARAGLTLTSDAPEEAKLSAIEILRDKGGRQALSILNEAAETSEGAVKDAASRAIVAIERMLAIWNGVQNIWYGLSLGSVLLLASIGLAITFGVMGVINMAHGEMVMLGAYTTFAVQQAVQTAAPGLIDYSLLFAIPAAFLVAGAVGFVLERGIIRFLYGRPLENPAGDMGCFAHSAASRAHHLWPNQSGGQQSGLDVRRRRTGWPVFDMEPHLDLLLCPCHVRAAVCTAQTHTDGIADARGHTKPQHGLFARGQNPVGGCLHLCAWFRHCRHRRGGTQPDRQRIAQSRSELHHR